VIWDGASYHGSYEFQGYLRERLKRVTGSVVRLRQSS
jgi:hypothetical protein